MTLGTPIGFGAHSGAGNVSSLDGNLPAGTVNGVAVVAIGLNTMSTDVTPPAGWSVVGTPSNNASNNIRLCTFSKSVTAADASTVASFGFSVSSRASLAGCIIPGGAIDVSVYFDAGAEDSVSEWQPITPTNNNEILVAVASFRWPITSVAAVTPPAGWTELGEGATTQATGPRSSYYSAYKVLVGQGGVQQAAPSATHDPARASGMLFAIKDAPTSRVWHRKSGSSWLPLNRHRIA